MIRFFKRENRAIVEINELEKGCWVNISPPFNQDNLKKLSHEQNIPFDYLIDSLDIDERSRYEIEDENHFVVLKTPIINENNIYNESYYLTIPVGIVITPENIFTVSAYDTQIVDDFINNKIKNIDPERKNNFLLMLFERNVYYFLQYLNELNNKRSLFEKRMIKSLENEKLVRLMNIEKSFVYFVTSLRSNEMLKMKLNRTNVLKFTESQLDLIEDIIVDNSQAVEMANIYTNILSSTMDTFASIISNNLNMVMRRLTTVTLILMVPTLIASLYGMNISLPLENDPMAFLYIIIISMLAIGVISWYFFKQKWL
jgi:magnesium transporter